MHFLRRLCRRSVTSAAAFPAHNMRRHRCLSTAASLAQQQQQQQQQQQLPQQDTQLQDEYSNAGHPEAQSRTFRVREPFALENGGALQDVEVAYTTYGSLNAARDNAIVLCHALTGHSLVHQWWDAIVRPEWTDKYFLVCANILGSCYGTTGPASIDPATSRPYGPTFPAVTVRDAVRLQKLLLQQELGVRQVQSVIGGSLGGMQTLEWAFHGREPSLHRPDESFVKSFVAIACNSHHTAWQIGVSEVQRQAIYMDPRFQNGYYDPADPPHDGLALARQIAMISYRTHAAYRDRYGRRVVTTDDNESRDGHAGAATAASLRPTRVPQHPRFDVQSYLHYQGQKFLSRFDVNAYLTLTHLMDTHDVGRGRGGVARALSTLHQPALVVGVDSDVLYPLAEQQELAEALPNATFHAIASPHGHDGFLLEQDAIGALIADFLGHQASNE
ncbi:hypothetical protein PINS_up000741 [Pythium insidiosum]|nr:hypothetical protein PINS_up000741 [Pythium insidiosum]